VNGQAIRSGLQRLRVRIGGNSLALARKYSDEHTLRSELFSVDQLEQHAKTLAGWHSVDLRGGPDRLLARLDENEAVLLHAYELVSAAVEANRRITPAAEWLLDNFYLIEEQIRMARRHLPRKYSRELPRLLNGASAGYPRVYDIALELISHVDGKVDAENLGSFVAAYQTVTVLRLGELWAIPIMLRLALIENLRRVAAPIAARRIDHDNANRWADRMTEVAEKDPKSLILEVADMARSNPPMSSAFVAELTRRLHGQNPALMLPLTWVEQCLSEQNQTIEQMVRLEGQRQAAEQVSISNSIGGLRFLEAMDWREFVETMSVVEQALRGDPVDVYSHMEFAARDRYRHAVERIARRSPWSEGEVASKAIELARDGLAQNEGDEREAHVGFYLIDKGLPQLEQAARMRRSVGDIVRKLGRRFPLFFYLGAITLLTVALTTPLLAYAHTHGLRGWAVALLAVPVLLCTSQLAIALVNWLAMLLVKPHALPRLDFSKGIPPQARTLVVVPTLLSQPQAIEELLEGLEVRYLANRDDHLHFGLLTDFYDAPHETMPQDELLLRRVQEGIEALNEKYQAERHDAFFLFHRPRRWNSQERIWMGYERKRGKLAELNMLLRGGARDRFSLIVGETSMLVNVKYVITLDTDTRLPRDAARQLVGTMAHPLNRPRYDENRQRVCEGYSILQPLVGVSLPGASRSWFMQLFGGDPGIDPYTRVVSDVYQDLFCEGSFIGKGIYEVDAFQRALEGRFPENLILSHDLLEGGYARAALMSDVQLYEEYPSRYSADVSRRHRWIRGDWQIMGWLLPRVPGPDARRLQNPLSGLSRWKILDNLRRSLVPFALTLLLLLAWTALWPAWFWTLVVIGILLLPPLLASSIELLQKPADLSLRLHLRTSLRSIGRHLAQAGFTLAVLPYDAFYSLDAIIRTGVRMLITHRGLLEWKTSSDAERDARIDLVGFYRSMWIAPTAAAAVTPYLALWRPDALSVAVPLLGLWLISPALAWWISRPIPQRRARLTQDQVVCVQVLARKTWRFFETFVGPEDHWLPPDNFQEYPVAVVAHRTSPTNMGLSLLANLAAYDFGYLSVARLIERITQTFRTLQGLERFRGHFYNWYDTRSLQPLHPHYISTVDSGNLAGFVLTLRCGLLELPDHPIIPARLLGGLTDTLHILTDAARAMGIPSWGEGGHTPPGTLARIERMRAELNTVPDTLSGTFTRLQRLAAAAAELAKGLESSPDEELKWWARAFERQCRDHLDDLLLLAPWVLLPSSVRQTWRDDAQGQRLGELYDVLRSLDKIPTLREVAQLEQRLLPLIGQILNHLPHPEASPHDWLVRWRRGVIEASTYAKERIASLEELVLRCGELAELDYEFLFDRSRRLLAIGYNLSERRRDASFYDLLASEARLSSFVAIAQGHLPQEHWFALGRLLTTSGGQPILLSWSGSMFEYLMPLLIMPSYDHTLLDQTCRGAVQRQIEYGVQRGVPWGISESGYNATDVYLNYQYRAFGVPGLGFKRGLIDDLVIAPYASAMALMIMPEQACANLQRMAAEGYEGRYGLYEAIDFTPSRLSRGQSTAVVRSFMTHHQGMIFLSLAHLLLDQPMQRRFESEPLFQAAELLLQERVPRAAPFYPHAAEVTGTRRPTEAEVLLRVFRNPDTPAPEVHLLSNGRYHVMVTNAGGGYSRWQDIAVTRWREDPTRDPWGSFCYIRDVASGAIWSAGYQPTFKGVASYEAIFSQARAEFRRREYDLDTHTEIAVSPEDDIELRRISITNRSRIRRRVELTSYAEVVLAPPAADATHPVFNSLFIRTEILRAQHAILCTRRPRSERERTPWMLHLMAVHGSAVGEASFETDRLKFIGRGRNVADPQALSGSAALSDSEGAVLDPIVAIRRKVRIDPDETVTVDIVSGIAETREGALALVEKYRDRHLADRVFELAWTHGQVVLRQLNATEADAQVYGRLASSLIYANPWRRADPGVLMRNHRGQSGLWGHGISGDLPIVLLRITDQAKIDLVHQLVQAHAYWRMKGLVVDLVIWNEDHSGYRQLLQERILGLIAAGSEAHAMDRPGGIFVQRPEQMPDEDRILLQTVARVIITDSAGPLAEQIERRGRARIGVPAFMPTRVRRLELAAVGKLPHRDLIFFNGLGGFTRDGREYVITLAPGQVTPAPWANVLANAQFGTVVSESGGAYTWSENAHEFRLTPWYNDPISDVSGEALYLRDEENGRFWSPTPLPARGTLPYVIRHGFGYSVFEYTEAGITSELWMYVALDAAVKFMVLKVRNDSGRLRQLSATAYVEWVLAELPPKALMHVITELDPTSGALFARNPYHTEFAERVGFLDVNETLRTTTCDRGEFLGRNGTPANPAAMTRSRLSGKSGPALDPCAAVQVYFELAQAQEREIVFVLGAGRDTEDARALVQRFRGSRPARQALEAVWHYWNRTLGAVYVETPDPSLNVLVNGWLLYQTLACRLWGRSGYYQSGGAFGFRDQLQDVMALIHTEPALAREHLLRCAAHQFLEGDVQHWWHPPSGRGVRTHCSDDYLWLALATSHYVTQVGDTGVLDERVEFIDGRPVKPDEEAYYDLPSRSQEDDTLYQHCVRAVTRGLRFGEHGLPLIGSGDWNDGMNRVGERGEGESVWLAFFLYEVLTQFSKLARLHNDIAFAERCEAEAARLHQNIEQQAWDGQWYRRAYFDDGEPLGSASSPECQIDSIPQSWSVLSGAGDRERSRMAMNAVDRRLIRRDHALIQLFDPPFDQSHLDPGYIKGYPPGVRENGGQYTHAAIWAVMAFAAMGDRRRAWELLSLINPVNHGSTPAGIATYRVEPYVVAADVYAVPPHTGRGGWTWYTGSAGWMYRLILESLLGLKLEVDRLRFAPCLPADWKSFKLSYRYRDTFYRITVVQPVASLQVVRVTVDGLEQPDHAIPLVDDGREHSAEVALG
jgi:cellobiose phosphorylase